MPHPTPSLPPTRLADSIHSPTDWSGEPPAHGRTLVWGAALVLIAGSLLFLAGGRGHPAISAALGATPEDFMRGFAEKVRHTADWHALHMMILVGPLCWAIAAPTLLDALRPASRGLTSAARSALVLSAALWAVAFVLDGFGAPVYASVMGGSASPDDSAAILTIFQANAIMMSRLGLVSWVAGGAGIAFLGLALLAHPARTVWHTIVAISGLALGAWPVLAALEGEYAGGPFTSGFWMMNALAAGLWFVALASCAVRRPVVRDSRPS